MFAFVLKLCFYYLEQWLQNVIALQCSIMRHLSIKPKTSSTSISSSMEWDAEQKADIKSSVSLEELKPLAPSERTPSPAPFSKPCSTSDGRTHGALLPKGPTSDMDNCTCMVRPCQNCRKPNGPLAEERPPPKANGPVDCVSDSRQTDLQHRLKPPQTSQDSAPTPASTPSPGLPNHIGGVMVKRESESPMEVCVQKDHPSFQTICFDMGRQQHHRAKPELQVECLSTLSTTTSSARPASQDHSTTNLGLSSSTPAGKVFTETTE